MFTYEYENDALGREKVDHSGKRKDNQISKVLEKVREGGERGSGAISHSDRKDTLTLMGG